MRTDKIAIFFIRVFKIMRRYSNAFNAKKYKDREQSKKSIKIGTKMHSAALIE
jgi:hypothetical protein